MTTASIAHLKAHLSSYLRQVREGNAVLVTDRGAPIARIVPVSTAGERRGALVSAGLLEPGPGRIRRSLLRLPVAQDGELGILAALLEERAEGR